MKAKFFLLCVSCFFVTTLFLSCGDEEVPVTKSNIEYKGYYGTKLNLNGVTIINAICELGGLTGYANVDTETSVALYRENVDGLMIFLKEYNDKDLTRLTMPSSLEVAGFALPKSAKVIEAFCYPHELSFKKPLRLTVETADAEGMDLVFSYHGKGEEKISVTTDSKGVYTEIPHFSYWVFSMNFDIKVLESKVVSSKELCCKVDSVNSNAVIKATYSVDKYSTESSNAFLASFLHQWVGESATEEYVYEFENPNKVGTEYYSYKQKVYLCSLTSGTRTFLFNVYDAPNASHVRFEEATTSEQ